MTRRERVVGLLLTHAYSYYRRILRGIARYAESRPHWRFVMLAPEIGHDVREALRNVDVAIVAVASHEWCDLVLESGVRTVNIDCVVPGLPIPRVGVDNDAIGELAARHFIERGIRSFAYGGPESFMFSLERERGFCSALARFGQRAAVYRTQISREYDIYGCKTVLDRGVGQWLLSLPRPTGLFTANDHWGMEAIELCRNVGLRVPDDVAVLGVDDVDLYCEIARPRLSSVVVPAEAIGRRAAALAEGLMNGRRSLKRDVLLPSPGVTVRRSTDVLAIDDADVVAAVRYIRENCHRPLQVADVLKVVNLSRRALERRVFEAIGITLGGEIRRTRLEFAKQLLAQTDLSIAEVAAQTGFTDFRHLAVTFRHELKQTPTEYRRACRDAARV